MTQLLVLILYKVSQLQALLEAWESIGVPGVTILRSAGGHRTKNWLQQMGLGAIGDLFSSEEVQSKTLLTLIDDEDLLERAIIEAERVVGDFYDLKGSLIFVLPVNRTVGVFKTREEGAPPPPVTAAAAELAIEQGLITRNMPVTVANEILKLEPVIVQAEQSLLEVTEAMIANPQVQVACVVNQQQRLIGLLSLQILADDLFRRILPEVFFSQAHDLEGVLDFARLASVQTAKDAMLPAVWVREVDTIKVAFHKMHEQELTGIPIVNDRYEVTGYINLLELLTICARSMEDAPDQENRADE